MVATRGRFSALAAVLVAAVAGCATPPPGPIQRLPEAQSRAVGPEAKRAPTPDELVAMAAQGVSATMMIDRLRASDARYDLKPSEAIALVRRGVPVEVLDALHEAWARGLQADVGTQLADRDRLCAAEAERIRQHVPVCPPTPWVDPYWGWPHWGRPRWGGGVYFGH